MANDQPLPLDRALVRQVAEYFDSWVQGRRETLQIPGIQVAVLHGDDLLLSRAHGLADVEACTELRSDTLFRVASHSKMFTAIAVLQLAEAQRLRLDDPVGDHLGWLRESSPEIAGVTLRELLCHGGGVIRDGVDGDFWQLSHAFPADDELRQLLGSAARTLPRNADFKYSNIGYALLGQVIEAVSGRSYAEYVQAEILDRLALTDVGPEYDPARAADYVTGYTGSSFGLPPLPVAPIDTAALAPATGFYGTAEQLCRFAAAQFTGAEVLLSAGSQRAMRRAEWKIEGVEEHYCLGLTSLTVGKRCVFGHGGGFPGQITMTLFDPEARLAVSVLTNQLGAPAQALAKGFYSLLDLALESRHAEPLPPENDRFCGRYASIWGVTDVVRLGNQLLTTWPGQPDVTEGAAPLAYVAPGQFTWTNRNGYDAHGESVTFELEGDTVRKLRAGPMTLWPLDTFRRDLTSVERIEVGGPRS